MTDPYELLEIAKSHATLIDYLFPEQRKAVEDPSPRKCLWTTGRAGKSTCVLTDFLHDGIERPHSTYFYFCLTTPHVESIAWPILKQLDRDFGLGCRFQEHKLRVILPTDSQIQLFGCDRPLALDRFYGIKLRKAAIDEAAFFNIDLEQFCEDTLGPRLVDERGQLYLMSTPPKIPSGLFDEIIKGFPKRVNMSGVKSKTKPRWSVHSWTTKDNPTMKEKFLAEIENLKATDPDVLKRPWFLRNYLGQRVQERGERVYEFALENNTYVNSDGESAWPMSDGDKYVLGIDYGWSDNTAFSLNVYRPEKPLLVEMESFKGQEMRMDDIAARIRMYVEYCNEKNIEIVGDPQHRQFFEELRRRYDLPIMPAEKTNKYDWIETVNNDFYLGNIKIIDPHNSPHVEEINHLTWKTVRWSKKRVEQPGAANDCCDAHLYAYRHAYHYIHEEIEEKPKPGTADYYQKQEDELLKIIEEEDEEKEGAWYE